VQKLKKTFSLKGLISWFELFNQKQIPGSTTKGIKKNNN
jgi:hypothetical protein